MDTYQQTGSFIVSALPLDHDLSRYFRLTVTWSGGDQWRVRDGDANCVSRTGRFSAEPAQNAKTPYWISRHHFPLNEALSLAHKAVQSMVCQGETAAQAAARWDARRAKA